jgi:hypothetical protein
MGGAWVVPGWWCLLVGWIPAAGPEPNPSPSQSLDSGRLFSPYKILQKIAVESANIPLSNYLKSILYSTERLEFFT